ncbi:MAG: GntR family transcriptional regulator [Sulfitobacter sp.]
MSEFKRSERAAQALMEVRSMILNGAFSQGDRLAETALATRLGLSRTPLRQAMDRLVDEGLLERINTGGCRVAQFSTQDIIDAIELRGVLEGTAARLAAERGIDDESAARLEFLLTQLDKAAAPESFDFDAYVRLNAAFHDELAGLARSPIIAREVRRASRLPAASPTAFLQGQEMTPEFRDSLHRAQGQHRAIFDAIVNREGSRAEAVAREHARLARTNLENVMKKRPTNAGQARGVPLVAE